MRTDLSAFNTAAALQELVCNTLLSSAELSALGIEFIPENRKDIDYQIKKNLTQQGLVGVCMTPTMNYVGHDGASIAYDVKGLTLQVVENVTCNRASNKVSCVTGLDVANYVASYLGGPQAAPGFGIFCPTGIEQGEDNGLIVTKVTFDCTIDGGYGGTFEPISGFHVYNPYVTRDDISSLIQLSIDFNAISAMMSAAISSMVGKADLSTVLSVRDDLRDEIADVSSNLSSYYLKSETSSASEISNEIQKYLPLSGGTVTAGSRYSSTTVISPGSISIRPASALLGGAQINIGTNSIKESIVVADDSVITDEISSGDYQLFDYLKVNSVGLNVALSAVQQRAIAEASGHLSALSDYYLKTETSSASEISSAIDPKIDKTEVAQISSSLQSQVNSKATAEVVPGERATTTLSVKNDEDVVVGTVTVDVVKVQNYQAMPGSAFSAGDPPPDFQFAGVITGVHAVTTEEDFYNCIGENYRYNMIGSVVPFTGHNYSFWETLPLFTLQGERGTLYLCFGDNNKSTGLDLHGEVGLPDITLTARESAALKASAAWREVYWNYYSKSETSSSSQIDSAFYARDDKINALSANDSYLSSQLSDAVHYTKDFAGTNTALTIGQRTESSSLSTVGVFSVVNGSACAATGNSSHAEGGTSWATANFSHAEGGNGYAQGVYSHAEGQSTRTYGTASHAEGYQTSAFGNYTHTEGCETEAYGTYSHAEGLSNITNGLRSHAEGQYNRVNGNYAHAEGTNNEIYESGHGSHVEGEENLARAYASHVAGYHATSLQNHGYSYVWNGDLEHSISDRYASHGFGTFNISPNNGLSGFYIGEENLAYIIDSRTSASQTVDELSAKVNNVSAEVDKLEVELYGGDKNKSVVNAFKLKRLWEQLNAYSSALSLELLSGDLSVQTMVQRTQDIYDIYGISCQPLSSMSALYAAVHDVGTATDLSTTFNLSFKQAFYDLVGDVTSHENTLAQLSVYEASTRNLIPVNVSDLSNDVHYTTWSGVRQYAYRKSETSSAIELSSAFANIQLSDVYKKNETSSASEISSALGNIGALDDLSAGVMYLSSEVSCKVDALSATSIARKEVADFQAQLSTIAPLSSDCSMQELLTAVNTIIAALKAQIIHS